MWVTATDLPTASSHPFFTRLNQLLREHGFDDFAEAQCARFYADTMGRPGWPPDVRVARLSGCWVWTMPHRTGESYQEVLTTLAEALWIKTPTRAALARLDRKRKNKGSNDDWTHPARSRCQHHKGERWTHASGAQGGARRRS
jgi:hypothetical protein